MTSSALSRRVWWLAALLLCVATLDAAAVAQETVDDVLAPLHPALLSTSSGDSSTTGSISGSTSGVSSTVEVVVPGFSLANVSGSAKSCEFNGQHIRHRGAKYLAGRTHKRGSIYSSCVDGHLSCFEDNGIADAPQPKHVEVACDRQLISQRRRKLGVAVKLQEDKWPDGLIWYRLNTTFSAQEKKIIREAIAVYESTDVKISFKECEPVTLCKNKYVSFEQNEDACYSYVGYVDDGEPQIVNLGDSCFDGSGTAVHEIGHALGLYHEHTHPEREVIILTDSDLPVSASNYAKETDGMLKPYDKGSIMHYGRSAGLCLPKDQYPLKSFCDVEVTTNCVMPVKQHCNTTKSKEIGQRSVLSAGDLNTLKALYGSKTGNVDNSKPVSIPDAGSDSDGESGSGSASGNSPTPAPSSTTAKPIPSPTSTTVQPIPSPTLTTVQPSPSPTPTTVQPSPSPPPTTEQPSPSPSPEPSSTPAPTTTAPSPSPVPTTDTPLSPSPSPTPSTARPMSTPTEAPTDAPLEPENESSTDAPATSESPVTTTPAKTPEPANTAALTTTPKPTTTTPMATPKPTTTTPMATPKPTTAAPTARPSTAPLTTAPSVTESPAYPVTSTPTSRAPSTAAPTPRATAKKTSTPLTAAPSSGFTRAPVTTAIPSTTVSPYVPGDVHGESSFSGSSSSSNGWSWSTSWFTDASKTISKWTENVASEYSNVKTAVKNVVAKSGSFKKSEKSSKQKKPPSSKSSSKSSSRTSGTSYSTSTTSSQKTNNGNGWGAYSNNGVSLRAGRGK